MKINHGIVSIILISVALAIGFFAIYQSSVLFSLGFVAVILTAVLILSVTYCAKCQVRNNCNHYIFGKVSEFLSKPNPEEYNLTDNLITAVFVGVVVIYPQFWLIENTPLFVAYWSLIAITGIDVLFFVCNKCKNKKCMLCRNKLEL